MKPKILIIEDDAGIVESVCLTFEIYWPEAELISTGLGHQGVALARIGDINVIILDLGLPDMDGVDVLKEVRTFSSVPVVILTAWPEAENSVLIKELKATDYIVKPFKTEELVNHIKSCYATTSSK